MSDSAAGGTGHPAHRYHRRLSDKILIAFHVASDQDDLEVAEQLLHILEMLLNRNPVTLDGRRRHNMEGLVAAYERLSHLRYPDRADEH